MTSAAPRPAPRLAANAHKGSAGRVLVIAGSRTMPGAAVLACRAAQRGGAGLVRLLCLDATLFGIVPVTSPETVLAAGDPLAVLADGQDDALVCGPGIGAHRAESWLAELVGNGAWTRPALLDADALNAFAGRPQAFAAFAGPLVLTPHPGEAGRLLGRPIGDGDGARRDAAVELAQRARAVVCLKGAGTVVTDGESVHVNATGNRGMATAGSGDVLSGLLGAYLALVGRAGWSALDAARAAVHVHGAAGDLAAAELGERALIASDLIAHLPAAQRAFEDAARERAGGRGDARC